MTFRSLKCFASFPTCSGTFYVVPDSLSEYLTRFKLFPIRSEVEGTLLWRAASDRDRKSVFALPCPASRRYIFFIRILPESQGKNLASTVFFVPYSLDSGPCCGETRPMGMGRASLLCPRPTSSASKGQGFWALHYVTPAKKAGLRPATSVSTQTELCVYSSETDRNQTWLPCIPCHEDLV